MYIAAVVLVFIILVSIDIFACGLAYGAGKIHVPFTKILFMNLVGKVFIGCGLFAGYYLGNLMPDVLGAVLGFAILSGLGLTKILQWYFTRRKIHNAKHLSWWGALVLGLILSFDGVAMAIGTMMIGISLAVIFVILGIMLFTDQLVFMTSLYLGKRLTKKANLNLGWLSGVILIAVAVCKLFLELFA